MICRGAPAPFFTNISSLQVAICPIRAFARITGTKCKLPQDAIALENAGGAICRWEYEHRATFQSRVDLWQKLLLLQMRLKATERTRCPQEFRGQNDA